MNDKWSIFLENLKEKCSDSIAFDTFLCEMELVGIENSTAIISIPFSIYKESILMNSDIIIESFKEVYNLDITDLSLVEKSAIQSQNNVKQYEIESNLREEFTFDQFVVGDSNKLAHAASVAVALNPGAYYNPLFIFGNSGLGKTHLINAIGNKVKQINPKASVLYIPTEEFVEDYVNSIKTNSVEAFREKYRHIDILLIDDIQWLKGKEKSHDTFFQIFNYLIQKRKQIVITSDRMPNEIIGLEQRLVSRFNSGLSVGVDSPEFETALAILRKKLELRNFDMDSIDEDVLSYMASHFSGNVRDLEGAVNRLIFVSILENLPKITMNVALDAFKDQITSKESTKLTADKIKKEVANYYNITTTNLVGKSRMSKIALARHISMYLMRELLNLSFISIGKEFGGRDHSTVMNACDKIEKLIKKDDDYKEVIEELKMKLR